MQLTVLKTSNGPARLQNLLLNRLQISPQTASNLIHKYLVDVQGPDGTRIHPTRLKLLPSDTTVTLPQFRLPLRSQPLVLGNDNARYSLLRALAFKAINKRLSSPLQEQVRILYEDERMLIVNKPYNLNGNESEYIKLLNRGTTNLYPIISEYTDKNTSGIMLYAKNPEYVEHLKNLLNPSQVNPQIQLIYWALTTNIYKETPLGELHSFHYQGRPDHRSSFNNVQRWTSQLTLRRELLDEGVPALTQWRHISTYISDNCRRRRKLGLYEIRPLTLRAHQLRVQFAEQLKCPVMGDWLYAPVTQRSFRLSPQAPLHLHLYQIRFFNNDKSVVMGENNKMEGPLIVTAPIPPHFIMSMNKYKLFLPVKPQLKKPKFPSNVKKVVRRFIPGSNR